MSIDQIWAWPTTLPYGLSGLYEALSGDSWEVTTVNTLEGISTLEQRSEPVALLICPDAALAEGASPGDALAACQSLAGIQDLTVVAVVGDCFLGTDSADTSRAMVEAAMVSVVRSISVSGVSGSRANAVCVPASMLGGGTRQRGPLKIEVGVDDVAAAIRFLIGPNNSYVNGQVLFVNAGRHLFSSMTA